MQSAFEIIAEPNRRAILSLLLGSERSVGEIERRLRMTQPAVSKHLRVLREAGFVESTVDAQRRLYRLRPEPLREVVVLKHLRGWPLRRIADHLGRTVPAVASLLRRGLEELRRRLT